MAKNPNARPKSLIIQQRNIRDRPDIATLPHMLFQVARLLVGLTAELALVRPVAAHHLQVLLESQAMVLGWDEAC